MKVPSDWPTWQGKLYIIGQDIDEMTATELRLAIRQIVPMVVETLPRLAELIFSQPPTQEETVQ